jgi:hypothetical protein
MMRHHPSQETQVARSRIVLVMTLTAIGMLAIPIGAIVVAGVLSGRPLVQPLAGVVRPAAMGLLLIAGVAAVLVGILSALGKRRLVALWRWWAEWRWSPVAGNMLLVLAALAFFTALLGGRAAMEMSWMVLMFLGFGIIGVANQRAGKTPFCARCGYEQTGESMTPDERDDRCPECGAFWRRPGGIVKGTRHPRRKVIMMVGIVIVISILPWMFLRHLSPGVQMAERSLVPTSVLIRWATAERGFRGAEWEVLSRRNLTPAQEAALITGILDKRQRSGGPFFEDRDWLERAIAGSRTPEHLLERYFFEDWHFSLNGPARASVGEEARISLRIRGGPNISGNYEVYAAFGGYLVHGEVVDGEPSRRGRSEQPSRLSTFVVEDLSLRPPEAGTARVSASIWVFAVPRQRQPHLQWSDAAPQLPPETVWSRQIDVLHELEVAP